MRDEPELKFSEEVDCGSCWIGNELSVVNKVENRGGDADFKLVTKNGKVEDGRLVF